MAIFVCQTELLQTSQSTEQVMCSHMSYDQFNQSCLAEGKMIRGVFILLHEAK